MKRLSVAAVLATAVVTAILSVSGVSSAQERSSSGLFERLFGGGERLSKPTEVLEERASEERQEGLPASGPDRLAQISGSDAIMRIDRLEAQIRQLTGLVEQLQYRNQQLEGQVKRIQEETEYRFQELRGGAPRASSPPARQSVTPAPVGQPPTPPAPGKRGDAFDPSQDPNAPGAPRPLGAANGSVPAAASVAPAPAREAEEVLGAPGGRGAGASLDLSTLTAREPALAPPRSLTGGEVPGMPRSPNPQLTTLPPSDSPKDTYDLAYGYILRRDYALAEDGFRTFLSKYPNDRQAPEAQYWLGESLFQRQLYRDAAENFLNVSTRYETTPKAPDAMLRLGQALAAMGEREAACASFGEVLRKYPRASIGVKQGVEREQRRAHC
jgi:tol-pal system protein YbgF